MGKLWQQLTTSPEETAQDAKKQNLKRLGSKGKPEEKKDMQALLDPKNYAEPEKTPACLTVEEATDLVRGVFFESLNAPVEWMFVGEKKLL